MTEEQCEKLYLSSEPRISFGQWQFASPAEIHYSEQLCQLCCEFVHFNSFLLLVHFIFIYRSCAVWCRHTISCVLICVLILRCKMNTKFSSRKCANVKKSFVQHTTMGNFVFKWDAAVSMPKWILVYVCLFVFFSHNFVVFSSSLLPNIHFLLLVVCCCFFDVCANPIFSAVSFLFSRNSLFAHNSQQSDLTGFNG